jgi:hypothetical protein
MALDEPKDTDAVFDINGFQFIIDENLFIEARPIMVDFAHFGFQLDCALQFDGACTACSTSSSCG